MARDKKVAKQTTPMPQVEKEYYRCPCCDKKYNDQDKNFYQSNSLLVKNNNKRMFICKKCVIELYAYLVETYEDTKKALYLLCRWLDFYFEANLYSSAEQQSRNSNGNIAQTYITKVNSLPQYSSLSFIHSSSIDGQKNEFLPPSEADIEVKTWSDEDKRNREDVIRLVGYDPFENENPMDQKYLCNTLVDFLDQDTVDDSFKLPICIEIVKSFNQIDKINQALALMTADISNVSSQVGGVKSLITAKKEIYSSILSMAKDNGISVNHNNNKSKGGNTLNGIVKKLNEIGLSTAELNLFDLETCEAMKQIADFSNKSIIEQLMFDENDYTDMISQQRDLIKKLDDELIKVKEDNRLMKIKINQQYANLNSGG